MKKTPLKRTRSLKSSNNSFKSKVGKKTLKWIEVRKELVEQFASKGIDSCEAKLFGCYGRYTAHFAHRMKRRYIKTEDELRFVAYLCNNCDPEYSQKDYLYLFVTKIVENRK